MEKLTGSKKQIQIQAYESYEERVGFDDFKCEFSGIPWRTVTFTHRRIEFER